MNRPEVVGLSMVITTKEEPLLEVYLDLTTDAGTLQAHAYLARASSWWELAEDIHLHPELQVNKQVIPYLLISVTARATGYQGLLPESIVEQNALGLCFGFVLHWLEKKGHSDPINIVLPRRGLRLQARADDRVWIATPESSVLQALREYQRGSIRRSDHQVLSMERDYWEEFACTWNFARRRVLAS